MKTEISSLELHFLLKELQPLVGGKVEQIYQLGKDEIVIQFHVTTIGKKLLRIILGKMLYLASNKGSIPEKPPGFCLYLRKKLKGARLREIKQVNFDRIVDFLLETKEAKYHLIAGLFGSGNALVCDEQYKILSALTVQESQERSIRQGAVYESPKKGFNVLELKEDILASILIKSDKDSLVKALAVDLSLGGTFSEEVCLRAGVDKRLKPNQLSDKEMAMVYSAINSIISSEASASLVYSDQEKQVVKDIVPIKLDVYSSLESSGASSFNEALDSVLTGKLQEKAVQTTEKAADTKIGKVEEMISQQRQRISGLEIQEKESQRKGETVYENYALVQQLISKIAEMRKTMSWAEIKQFFKGHKIISNVDEKTGEVTIEV